MSQKGPVKGVRIDYGRYFRVKADGKRRIWVPLTRADEGLPALFRALAKLEESQAAAPDTMPALIADWERDVMSRHAPKTQKDELARGKVIAESFSEFRACEVRPPDVVEFLRVYVSKPRTHNLYRAQIRELMRYAEERGFRDPGTNPVTALRTIGIKARDRYISDSELRRIKVAGMYGDDGKHTRSGPMLAALVDMAHLTGQRIGDLLALEWDQITDAGIAFRQSKTGAKVVVEWTPKLQDVVARLKAMRKARRGFTVKVFTTQDGKPYTYSGAITAWKRAVGRAGVRNVKFHDIRAKAATDTEVKQGMQAARVLMGHTTEQQTSDYTRARTGRKAKASR